MVVIDKQDYLCKAQNLLEQHTTYKYTQADPSRKQRAKLISLVKRLKTDIDIEDNIYKNVSDGAGSSKLFGLPKSTKTTIPSGP